MENFKILTSDFHIFPYSSLQLFNLLYALSWLQSRINAANKDENVYCLLRDTQTDERKETQINRQLNFFLLYIFN